MARKTETLTAGADDALATLRRGVAEAEARITDAQDAALLAALRLRDVDYGRALAIVPDGDPSLKATQDEYTAAKRALDQARTDLYHLRRDLEHEQAEAKTRALAADQERRRRWVAEHRPELASALAEAEAAVSAILASPYWADSGSAQHDLRMARVKVAVAQAALDKAAEQAPEVAAG